jgi:hypothetical protein
VAAVVPGHAAAPAVPATRARRHEWLAALSAAARTPRGAIGLILAGLIMAVADRPQLARTASRTSSLRPRQPRRTSAGTDCWAATCCRVLDGGWCC